MTRDILLLSSSILIVLAWLARDSYTAEMSPMPDGGTTATCPVTLPRKSPLRDFRGNVYWQGELFVAGLPSDGTLVFRPRVIMPDGLFRQKFGWYRGPGLTGKLTITGKRLDGPSSPLKADVPQSYGDSGFQATELTFPTEGCWQVRGKVNKTSVVFVVRVVRSADDAQ